MANYLENLPPDLQREIALSRRIGLREYASLIGYSIDQTRRFWKAGKIPEPDRLGGRKLTIPLGVAQEAAKSLRKAAA